MILKVLYINNIKIEINILLYKEDPEAFKWALDKCFYLVPKKVFENSVNKIIIGFSTKLKEANKTATYENGTIFISEDFLRYKSPKKKLLNELIHEMGHAFIESFQDELFADDSIYKDFTNLKKKVSGKIPEFEPFINQHNDRESVDDFIRNIYGEGEFYVKTAEFLSSPYTLLEIDEFIVYYFEEYYLRYKENVQKYNPIVFKILEEIEYAAS